jgi:hypothetical protein
MRYVAFFAEDEIDSGAGVGKPVGGVVIIEAAKSTALPAALALEAPRRGLPVDFAFSHSHSLHPYNHQE